MSRKVLFVATVLRMHVLVFHLPYMRWFQEQGYEVHLCCANDTPDPHPQVPYCDRWVELPFSRSPFSAVLTKAKVVWLWGSITRLSMEMPASRPTWRRRWPN